MAKIARPRNAELLRQVFTGIGSVGLIIVTSSTMQAYGGRASTEVRRYQWDGTSTVETEGPASGVEQNTAPLSPWDERKYLVAVGYSGSTVDVGIDPDRDDRTFKGWGLSGRIALNKRWGLQFDYRNMEDNEDLDSGEDLTLDMVVVHSYLFWAKTEYTRWSVKFGLAWTDFDSNIPAVGTFSDQALGPSIGGGFEWGSPKYAAFIDIGFIVVDIELIPGEQERSIAGNTFVGFSFKF